nr:MAG TPA: hypothetical protein [Bacteriophage sp.]
MKLLQIIPFLMITLLCLLMYQANKLILHSKI